jgi:hemerythrin-like domain-containing protein
MTTQQPIDVRDMAIVHKTFRNMFTETAGLVRANSTPSASRVAFLADHVDFGLMMLHHHHEVEDEYLYPLMVARAPDQVPMLNEVEHQHEEVAGTIEAAEAASGAWRAQPSVGTGEGLAQALDQLNTALQPHLDDEEQKVVPLAAVTLSQEEWSGLGERGDEGIPKDKLAVAFGMLLEPLSESDRSFMKAQLPLPVRLLYPILIQRKWDAYARTLRTGT